MENQKFATYGQLARSLSSYKDYGMLAPWNSSYRYDDMYQHFDADKCLIAEEQKTGRIKHQKMLDEYAEYLVPCVEEVLPDCDILLEQKDSKKKIAFEDLAYSYNRETKEYCLVMFYATIIIRHYPEKVQSSGFNPRKPVFEAIASNFPLKQYCIWTLPSNTFYNSGTDRCIKHDWCKASFLRKKIEPEIIKECITGKYVRPWDVHFRSYRILFNICIPKWVISKDSSCYYLIAGE